MEGPRLRIGIYICPVVLKGRVRDSGGEVARFFSKNGGNTSLIRKNLRRKICKTEFQFPGQRTPHAAKFAPAMTNSRNSSAQLTC